MLRPLPILAIVISAGSGFVPLGSTRAQFSSDAERQAQCEIDAIGATKSPVAVDFIRTACNRLAIDAEGLDESNRRYHLCLVKNLSGAQDDAAAARIISSCRTLNPP
jgi:hypothetical protein